MNITFPITACLFIAAILSITHSSRAQVDMTFTDFGPAPDGLIDDKGVFASPTHDLIAWVELHGAGVRANGAVFANETQGGTCTMIINRRPQKPYGLLIQPAFSDDGKHYAYVATKGNEFFVIVDGKEIKTELVGISSKVLFSGDSKTIAFVGDLAGTTKAVYWQGKLSKPYAKITQLCLSSHGTHDAFAAEQDGKRFAVIDGAEQPAHDEVYLVQGFSADEKHFVYGARDGKKWRIILDGKPLEPSDDIGNEGFLFSADSVHGAYVQIDKVQGSRLVHDAVKQLWCKDIANITFSPDSGRYAYTAGRGSQAFQVLDGLEQPAGDHVGPIVFSKTRRAFAYWKQKGNDFFIVWNQQQLGPFEAVDHIRLSDDGGHIAYDIMRDGYSYACLDQHEGSKHLATPDVQISPDGKSIAYIATGKSYSYLVVNEFASPTGMNILPGTSIRFIDDHHVSCAMSSDEGHVMRAMAVVGDANATP